VSKETYYSVKRDLQCQKRPTSMSKETYYSVKRDLLQCQKRPTSMSKETYYSVKRHLLQCQKRPTTLCLVALPETDSGRGASEGYKAPISRAVYALCMGCSMQSFGLAQKRPTLVSQETYNSVKRDLHYVPCSPLDLPSCV
jgi:hypothetical protein